MEKNQMFNYELKNSIGNAAVGIMLNQGLAKESELVNLSMEFGYLFLKDDGVLEGLLKVKLLDRVTYFAAQKGSLMLINIDEEKYNSVVAQMKEFHPCILENGPSETETQKNRREKNNKYISEHNITTADRIVSHIEDSEAMVKSQEDICKRAIACLLVVQIACDIGNGEYKEGLDYFKPIIEKFGLLDELNSKEKKIIDGTYEMQDAIDMDWAYEAYWSLCWCLGLVDDIKDAGDVCDCQAAIDFVMDCQTVDDLMKKCNMRSKEEILDMIDLYFRYQWAINEAKVNPKASVGNLNPSIVIERRRGLEWIVSEEDDWYDIDLWA